MATTMNVVPNQIGADVTFPIAAATDLSASIYHLVKDNNGPVVLAGAGEATTGILQDAPKGTSFAKGAGVATVRCFGLSLLSIGSGGCSAGDFLKSGASGEGIATTTDRDIYSAVALSDASSGDQALVRVASGTVSHA